MMYGGYALLGLLTRGGLSPFPLPLSHFAVSSFLPTDPSHDRSSNGSLVARNSMRFGNATFRHGLGGRHEPMDKRLRIVFPFDIMQGGLLLVKQQRSAHSNSFQCKLSFSASSVSSTFLSIRTDILRFPLFLFSSRCVEMKIGIMIRNAVERAGLEGTLSGSFYALSRTSLTFLTRLSTVNGFCQ
jgi:hypothetical protein